MGRWVPGAADRLRDAALTLFDDQGFEQTTAIEIAEAAGVTERTFYRYFADKREVLFGGQDELHRAFADGVAAAGTTATPLEMVASALEEVASLFPDERRERVRRRAAVIAADRGLQERELLKMATLAAAVGEGLRARGVPEPAAHLAAESGITVFRLAVECWAGAQENRSLPVVLRDLMEALRATLH